MCTAVACVSVIGAGMAACGSGSAASAPPACGLLTDADIQAAVHQAPAGEGGGGTTARSTCVWALPSSANGSISAVLISCGPRCGGTLASLAPQPAFSDGGDTAGPGVTARVGATAIVIEKGGEVAELVADHLGSGVQTALAGLARRAAQRM